MDANFGDWLSSQHWDYFATLTYPKPYSVRSARRAQEAFWKDVPGTAIWVTERGTLTGRVHNHALLRLPHPLTSAGLILATRQRLWKHYRHKFKTLDDNGDIVYPRCDFDPYKGESGARYCAKYITKQPDDWDISLCQQTIR
jgi:hypothetical protein